MIDDSKSKLLEIVSRYPLPTEEKDVEERLVNSSHKNPNRFSAWYPLAKEHCKTPETIILPISVSLLKSILTENISNSKKELDALSAKVAEFGKEHGFPLFIKNGLFSSKHAWEKTCFIDENSNIKAQICNIFYDWEVMGDSQSLELVVREFIDTRPVFTAYHGKMPITKEFRFFSVNGRIESYQPYWPEMALHAHTPSVLHWKEKLKGISVLSPSELATLLEMTTKIAKSLCGEWSECPEKTNDWSIDVLCDKDGEWWFIDAAQAHRSYKMLPEEGLVTLPL